NTQNSRSIGRKNGRRVPQALEHRYLVLQCNALPNQCSASTTICPGSFDDVATELNHPRSLCPNEITRQRFGSNEVVRKHGAGWVSGKDNRSCDAEQSRDGLRGGCNGWNKRKSAFRARVEQCDALALVTERGLHAKSVTSDQALP